MRHEYLDCVDWRRRYNVGIRVWVKKMKQTHLIASLCLAFGALSIAATPAAAQWEVGATSKVGFSFQQQGTKYTGRFDTFTANIDIDHPGKSIVCTVV